MEKVLEHLQKRGISIRGIIHIGAHECEERGVYNKSGITDDNIEWVEANPALAAKMNEQGIKVYNTGILDKEEEIPFFITNNGQSSSFLQFGTHAKSYPHIKYVKILKIKTQTLASFIENNNIPIHERNFWNLDIQGVELNALKSAGDFIKFADVIFTEVNTQEVYKGCSKLAELDEYLLSQGLVRVDTVMWGNDGWGDALYVRV